MHEVPAGFKAAAYLCGLLGTCCKFVRNNPASMARCTCPSQPAGRMCKGQAQERPHTDLQQMGHWVMRGSASRLSGTGPHIAVVPDANVRSESSDLLAACCNLRRPVAGGVTDCSSC